MVLLASTLPGLLEEAAATRPHAPALLHANGATSFSELLDRARRLAAYCRVATAPNQAVAFIGENHLDWVAGYYGVPAASRRLCFLNHRLAQAELHEQLERAEVGLVIGSRSELDRLDSTVDSLEFNQPLDATSSPLLEREDQEGSWLLFTSGATGRPKGVLLSSGSVLAACASSAVARPIRDDEVFAFPFPLCHVAGYNVIRLHRHLRPVALLDRFDAKELITTIERHQVTSVSVAATMLASFLDALDQTGSYHRVASLRTIAYGAAPMPAALLTRTTATLGVELTQGYGMTELSGNAVFLDASDHARGFNKDPTILATAGRPGPSVDVQIVGPDGAAVAHGDVGEITVAGPQVMLGYLDDKESTTSTLVNGWLHTGDLGRIRPDGLLEIVDRLKDIIITGGENVASREVEDAIMSTCPEISSLAVVGVDDERWGQNVCCCATLKAGTTLDIEELAERLVGHLAGYKIPRHLVLIDHLPLTASGKVAKGDVRLFLAEHPELVSPRRGSESTR